MPIQSSNYPAIGKRLLAAYTLAWQKDGLILDNLKMIKASNGILFKFREINGNTKFTSLAIGHIETNEETNIIECTDPFFNPSDLERIEDILSSYCNISNNGYLSLIFDNGNKKAVFKTNEHGVPYSDKWTIVNNR